MHPNLGRSLFAEPAHQRALVGREKRRADAEAGREAGELRYAVVGRPVDVAGQNKKRRIDNHAKTSGMWLAMKLAGAVSGAVSSPASRLPTPASGRVSKAPSEG